MRLRREDAETWRKSLRKIVRVWSTFLGETQRERQDHAATQRHKEVHMHTHGSAHT
jgi:hypothetical protein